ncbi:uncharacterized protein LOC136073946 [Hydra vulgaris]|uniref:uncharacterized protein LOC136073946 n=1 Tax=Hydra vulgaris TaxID=6087 RepID=UPI0032E9E5D7
MESNSDILFCASVKEYLKLKFKKYPTNVVFFKGGEMEIKVLKNFNNVQYFDLNKLKFPKVELMEYFLDESMCNAHFKNKNILKKEHLDHCPKYETRMLKNYSIDFIYHVKRNDEKREEYKELVDLIRENNYCEEVNKTTCKCFDNVYFVNKTYYTMPNKFIEIVEQVINNIENGEINLIKDVENVKLIEKDNNCNFIVYNVDQCQSDQCKIEFDKIEFDFCYRKQDASDNQIKIEKSNLKEEIKEELRNLDCRVSIFEEPTGLPDGQKIFVIKDIVKRMNLNSNGYYSTYYSAPFFYKNYKMSIGIIFNVDINLNDEMIHGDYFSIFVVLMSHIYDAVLKWPFSNKRGTISLLGGKNFKKSFITNDSVYFQRPIEDQMNPAFGFGRFIKKTDLLNYIVEDSLFIKCKIN